MNKRAILFPPNGSTPIPGLNSTSTLYQTRRTASTERRPAARVLLGVKNETDLLSPGSSVALEGVMVVVVWLCFKESVTFRQIYAAKRSDPDPSQPG